MQEPARGKEAASGPCPGAGKQFEDEAGKIKAADKHTGRQVREKEAQKRRRRKIQTQPSTQSHIMGSVKGSRKS